MKWFVGLLVGLSLLCAEVVTAQTLVWEDVVKGQWPTVEWSGVTMMDDGDPIPSPADAALSYNIYIKNVNTGVVVTIANTTSISQVVPLPKKAKYFVGVETQLLWTGDTEPMKSIISWSDNALVCAGGQTFGLRFYGKASQAKSLRLP